MENQVFSVHELKIKNREEISISGVNKIISLNKTEFIIDTIMGNLVISGNNLEMVSLDCDKGLLSILGQVSNITYEKSVKTKEKSFLAKVFK